MDSWSSIAGRDQVHGVVEVGEADGPGRRQAAGSARQTQEEGAGLLLELRAQEGDDGSCHAALGHAAVRADVADDLDEPVVVVQGEERLPGLTQDRLQQR